MKSLSTAYKASISAEVTTLAFLWLVTRKDAKVFGFTDHDVDIVYGGVIYQATAGLTASNFTTSDKLNVDNLEAHSVLNSATITEADCAAGLWDYASVQIQRVNYSDLSQGVEWMRKGTTGQLTAGRTQFIAELRGMTQALQQTIGRVVTPSCGASLGDSKCTVNMVPFTVTGSVTGTIDQHGFNDTARTETNSTVQKAVSGITQASPAVVTCTAHGFSSGQQVNLSAVVGMTQINGVTAIINYIDANTFSLNGVDSTNFSAYTSGGTATLEGISEYFQGGVLTWTSGLNAGLSFEVKNYYPGYVYLMDAAPYPIQTADTYSMTAGCDLVLTTCISRFNNVVNFRGFPHVPGIDRMIAGT